MDKQDLITLAEKIKQALNAISVSGYGNIKTLSNCIEAMTELEKNIDTYQQDIQKELQKHMEEIAASVTEKMQNGDGILPVNPEKPKPKRIKKEVGNSGEN